MFLPGLSPELAFAAGCVFVFGLWVASRDLPLPWALPLVLLKVAIPVAYFAQDPFGLLHLEDDLAYYYGAVSLRQRGVDIVAVVSHPVLIRVFFDAMGSMHVGYPLWNLTAISIFGPHYFAPVLMNVGLTFVGGWLFVRILAQVGFPPAYRVFAVAFFLLHWDVVVWSSFLNLKDTLAMALTLAAMNRLLALVRAPGFLRLVLAVLPLAALVYVRFYAPALILAALGAHLAWPGASRARLIPAVGILLGLAAIAIWKSDVVARGLAQADPAGALFGIVRLLLTPLPWNLSPGYGFLLMPSLLHLFFLVPALLAGILLWGRPGARFLLMYGIIVLGFYALFPDLQGSRQRLQASFVFIWLQFHVIWTLARLASRPTGRTGESGAHDAFAKPPGMPSTAA